MVGAEGPGGAEDMRDTYEGRSRTQSSNRQACSKGGASREIKQGM